MKNSRIGYAFGLAFFSLLFWMVYIRIVFDPWFSSIFKENLITVILHWFISKFDLTEYKIKLMCVFMTAAIFYIYKSYTKTRPNLKNYYITGGIALLFMFYPFINLRALPLPIGLFIGCCSFPLFLFCVITIKKVIYSKKIDQDQFNLENQSFMQEKEVIDTKYSLNYLLEFYYNGKKHLGAINMVEIFRSVWVYGVMGSGKTFTFLLPAIYQLIKKGFCLAIYDHKFPSMSKKTYAFYKILKPNASFFQMCFTDMRYSNKCNAIEPKNIPTITDITNVSLTILKNLKDSDERGHAFFDGSAEGICTSLIAILKKMQFKYNKEVCSVPHVIILASVKIKYLLPILLSNRDILLQVASLRDAFAGGAAEEQLTGQTATLQNKLKKLINKDFFFIASGKSDFSLDLNDPYDKKILTIGAHEDKAEVCAPYSSLYFEIISKLTSQEGKSHFAMVIDEFSSLYFKNFLKYLELGRERLCALIAGLQGVTQLSKKYSPKEAETIQEIQGTVIAGMAGAKTSKMLSEKLGKTNQRRSSVTESSENVSVSHSFYESDLVPPSRIANFSPGEFTGVIADKFENKLPQKRFLGNVLEHTESTSLKTDVELPQIYSFDSPQVQQNIKDHLKEMKKINLFSLYKKAILSGDFSNLPDNITFYLDFLNLDQHFFKSEHNHIKSMQEKEQDFDINTYLNTFFSKKLKTTVLDNEKELFLDQYMDSLFNDIEFWVKKEYQSVTGKTIDDDLFQMDDFQDQQKDLLYF
ncbi:TraM recognition domain-containing protein (plasmid) [Aquimarina sp. TRL1]|uniref:type IV secretory system conjugative DNA transfer family protein n=1 Tax=Aquimarina sp. (strain TRL1) TaxID=2736252 RepID=UPI00158BE201|nr:TraM recognition domain-containing protein [Aquimarina sp. TRL1]QKX07765.1 TraM recognition domain-containing protein [Aquimarina sp. TRL1]